MFLTTNISKHKNQKMWVKTSLDWQRPTRTAPRTNVNLCWNYPQPGAVFAGVSSSPVPSLRKPTSPPSGPSAGVRSAVASGRPRLRLGGLLAWSTGGRLSWLCPRHPSSPRRLPLLRARRGWRCSLGIGAPTRRTWSS